MPKEAIYKLKVSLKAGEEVFPKGKVYPESELPQVLRDELLNDTGTIEIIAYGDEIEVPEAILNEEIPEKPVSTKKIIRKKKKV